MNPRSFLTFRVAAPLALCAAAFALPAIVFKVGSPIGDVHAEEGKHRLVMTTEVFGHTQVRFRDSDLALRAEIEGKVTFDASEADIASLSDEAFIEQTIDGREHRIDFENDAGTVKRRYRLDGDDAPFDANAKAWLARVIPTLLRETGIDAEARVARIHAKGGAAAVLAETTLVRRNYARRTYLVALFELDELNGAELDRAIELAGDIDSDFERRSTYESLLETQTLSVPAKVKLLDAIATIGSDSELRSTLEQFAPKLGDDEAVLDAYGRALAGIESDFELRSAIEAAATRGVMSKGLLHAALRASQRIGSDFELRSVLTELARHVQGDGVALDAWIAAARGIGSDFEMRSAIEALLDESPLDVAQYGKLLDLVESIGSDFEQRTALEDVARDMPSDPALRARYRALAEKLGDFEQNQALAALRDR